MITVCVIVAIILLIQVANHVASENLKKQSDYRVNEVSSQESSKSPNVIHTNPIISGGELGTNTASNNQKLIDDFIVACNNGDIELAYSYLSSDCKNKVFSSIDDFKDRYYTPIFSTKKEYNIENWISMDDLYTYRVSFVNDILSSGTISNNIEDYITVVNEEGEKKLNIFRYIKNDIINKSEENDILKIEVIDRDIYDEYEVYNIKASNKSQKTIMINRAEDNDGISVKYQDNDVQYSAFITEIYDQNLILNPNQEKYISIKINKIYNGKNDLDYMTFSDIINDKDTFDKTDNINNYSDFSTLIVDLK